MNALTAAVGQALLHLLWQGALRIHGVSPEYVSEMKSLGVSMTDDQAIALRIHGVSPEYVRHLRDDGFTKAGPDDLVRLRISGVDDQSDRSHDKHDFGE